MSEGSAGRLVWEIAGPAMPPLPESRMDVYAYYKLGFLPDGYPGRQTPNGLVPHPLYGNYVISDYLSQYKKTNDRIFLDGAIKIGEAAIGRMSIVDDALIFYYTTEMGLSNLSGRFYSGLTQARYISTFTNLWRVTRDQKYRDVATGAFNSLTIPVERGGVLRHSHGGSVIEEWPNINMPDFTLNGWTTALRLLADFVIETGSPAAHEILAQNLVALEALLPLYDVPEVANSRYRLSGPTWIRLTITGAASRVIWAAIEIPGIAKVPFSADDRSDWNNYLIDELGEPIMLRTHVNYASYPNENVFECVLESNGRGSVLIEIESGQYSPLRKSGTNKKWEALDVISLSEGRNNIAIPVSWQIVNRIVSATTFAKVIGGRNYNAYHFMHISNLEELSKKTGHALLSEYARKWREYTERWPSMAIYKESGVALTPIGGTRSFKRGAKAVPQT